MRYCILASGSKGNMTYIETDELRLLLDAGLSYKEMMRRSPIEINKIDAILLTHEHIDHVSGLITIAKRTGATIYATQETYESLLCRFKEKMEGLPVQIIQANRKYVLNDLQLFTLRLSHDSASCLGFIFSHHKKSLAYVTDTGFLPLPYLELLKKTQHLIIEANHDVEMLQQSARPWELKQRILSVRGHMSNIICGQIVNTLAQERILQQVILAHLSEECNTEVCAVDTVIGALTTDYLPHIKVARQHEALEMIEVSNEC